MKDKKITKKEIPQWPSPSFACANPKKRCLECQKGINESKSCHNDSAGPEDIKYIRIYPSAGDEFLFSCDCGEIRGLLPMSISMIWLKLSVDDVHN